MKRYSRVYLGILAAVLSMASQVRGDVLARYTFDGRTGAGQRTRRPHDAFAPYTGSNYVADASEDEFGPTLENPGGGGYADFYQSYYNHSASAVTTNREVLEMNRNHAQYYDRYRTAAGVGMVPLTGSFTWEAVVSVLSLSGVTSGGRTAITWLITSNFKEDVGGGDYRTRGANFRFDNLNAGAGTYEALFNITRNVWGHSTSVIATNLSVSNFYHFACVYDDDLNVMRLYVDEVLEGSASVVSYTRTNEVGICGWNINAASAINPGSLKGFIDDLAFTDDVRRPGNFVMSPKGTSIIVR